MELNKEQLKLIEFLYSRPDSTFSYNDLKQHGIIPILEDCQRLQKAGYIKFWGGNQSSYLYQIDSAGRAFYEQHLILQQEKTEKEKQIYESNKRAEMSNAISVAALVVSGLISAAALIVSILTYLKA